MGEAQGMTARSLVVRLSDLWVYGGKLEAIPGAHIRDVAAQARALADALGTRIQLAFNGRELIIEADTAPEDIVRLVVRDAVYKWARP